MLSQMGKRDNNYFLVVLKIVLGDNFGNYFFTIYALIQKFVMYRMSSDLNLAWIAPKFQSENHVYPALSVDLFKSIIEQAKPLGLSTVKLTGGEPLLHAGISKIIGYIKAEDLNLTIETRP